MKNHSSLLVASFFVLLIIPACKDDDGSVDPCEGEIRTTAEFDVVYRLHGTDSVYWLPTGDTIDILSSSSKVYFRAQSSEMETYSWRIGADARTFTDSVFFLNFASIEGDLDATLTVTNKIKENCYPDDNRIDTLTKAIYMKHVSTTADFPLYGSYEGFDESAPDSLYTIEIQRDIPLIYHFPNGCDRTQGISILMSSRRFVFDEKRGYTCGHPTGKGEIQSDNKTLIMRMTG